ncbi:MAG: hypothetical protein ACRDRN_21830 [Sciscionella sp.]
MTFGEQLVDHRAASLYSRPATVDRAIAAELVDRTCEELPGIAVLCGRVQLLAAAWLTGYAGR